MLPVARQGGAFDREKMSCFVRVAAAMNDFVREETAGDNGRPLMFTKTTINCFTDERF